MFSLRRATYERGEGNYKGYISIHALLTESDLMGAQAAGGKAGISIHALLTESDSKYHQIGPIVSV